MVIDTTSTPSLYRSRASPKLQCSGLHWTRNYSTQVERRPCLTRRGALRAIFFGMDALFPGASLRLRDSTVVGRPRLELDCRRVPVFPVAGKFKRMRVQCTPSAFALTSARCARALSMESCLFALSTSRGEGQSGMEPQSWPIMVLHRGAIESSGPCGSTSFWQSDSRWAGSLEDKSTLR